MWERLPQHLRAGLVLSIIVVVAAGVASFTLSFIALREVAGNQITGWGQYAWVFPVAVDMGLIGCEIAYLTLSMMRGTGLQQLAMVFFMLVFGAFTIYFNAERVPPEWRMVTGAPPLIGIILTMVFATLLKAFVRHIGKDWAIAGGNEQVGDRGIIRGAAYRTDYRAFPTDHVIGPNGHNGHELSGGNGASKTAIVRAYLDQVPRGDLRRITAREIQRDLESEGHKMTVATISPVLTEYRKRHLRREPRR